MKGIYIMQGGLWGACDSSISIFARVIVTGMQLYGLDYSPSTINLNRTQGGPHMYSVMMQLL